MPDPREAMAAIAYARSLLSMWQTSNFLEVWSEGAADIEERHPGWPSFRDAYLAKQEHQTSGPTVRVRAAVAVGEDGRYSVTGWTDADDDLLRGIVVDNLDPPGGYCVSFIEADVPACPAPATVQGRVVG